MNKKQKLTELLTKLDSLQRKDILPSEDVSGITEGFIAEEVANITAKLNANPTIKTLQRFTKELAQFKQEFNLAPLIQSVKDLQAETKQSEKDLLKEFETRIKAIKPSESKDFTSNIEALRNEFISKIVEIKGDTSLKNEIDSLRKEIKLFTENDTEEDIAQIKAFDEKLKKLQAEINSRIANIGGGSMNRAMYINGVDPLTRYTDVNFKAGPNMTISYTNNNTTKKVDITFTASGGGWGGGIVREIDNVSSDTAAGNTSGTDYVYLVTGTTTITLPDATANTNLYTIKNVGTGVVTVATTSSQTIDGSLTITLPVRYTSVDIESDTANWNVT